MPRLVHITADTDASRIRRNGIRARRLDWLIEGSDRLVWAFPVLESYTLTHQWARELKRWGRHTLAAVTFTIDDAETVYVRHFSGAPIAATAAQAVALVRNAEDPRGYEILVPRRIEPHEIAGIRVLPRAFGWRYWPGAKNSGRMACECPVCAPRGEVKARRYRDRIPLMQARYEARAGASKDQR
ncbi:MAG: hypothetical protein AB7O57_11920 [Hyphomicrobiaceae bacterium]